MRRMLKDFFADGFAIVGLILGVGLALAIFLC